MNYGAKRRISSTMAKPDTKATFAEVAEIIAKGPGGLRVFLTSL
jgi:hypothetical protein